MIKFKKLVFLMVGIVLIVVLVACGNGDSDEDQSGFENNFSLVSWMPEYGIEGEHRFYDVNMYDALQLRNEEDFDGILLFAFPECPWCQKAVPVIHEASQEADVDVFYVSRTHSLREGDWLDWDAEMAWWLYENGTTNMVWIDEEGDVITDNSDNELYRPNINVPQIVHLRNGIIVDSHRGTFEGHDRLEDGSLPELTVQQRAILLEVYMRFFSVVNEPEICPIDADDNDENGCS